MYSLIHLSGRQLLPNVLANLAFSRAGLLERSVVLHTDNKHESLAPAQRLFELLRPGPSPDERIECLRIEVEETLQSVTEEVLALFDEFPRARWVLHATGGNKMMSAALVLLARHPRVAAVVYRNIVNGWRSVTLAADGGAPMEEPVARDHPHLGCLETPGLALDALPLEQLIRAQFADDEVIVRFTTRHARRADVAAWLATASARHGRFATPPHWDSQIGSEGKAFECWLAAMLRAAGARQVLWNCEGFSPRGPTVIETDVVALHGNRLAIYDTKLEQAGARGKSEQIRAARLTADKLGGLSAAAVLVRPNWPATAQLQDFAQALGVQLVNRGNFSRLVELSCRPLALHERASTLPVLHKVTRLLKRVVSDRHGLALFAHS